MSTVHIGSKQAVHGQKMDLAVQAWSEQSPDRQDRVETQTKQGPDKQDGVQTWSI